MRILLVSSSSGSRGGGEIFLLYLAEVLQAAGHFVALWASRHARMDELATRFATYGEVIRADYRNTYDAWHRGLLVERSGSALASIRESWLAWKPDVIHLNKQNLEDGLDLLAAAADLRVANLATVHITQSARFLGARFAALRDKHARRTLSHYRHPLVAVAPARARELRDFAGPGADVRVVLNGVPPFRGASQERNALRAAEGLRPDSIGIVDVGRLEPQKSPLRFLHYAAMIRATTPNAEFRWMGGGRMSAAWDREVAARNLAGAVRRFEWRDDVRATLPAYDLMLHPAAYEGLSLALLEAMDAGVPCAVEPAVHSQLPRELQSSTLAVSDTTDWGSLLHDRARLGVLGKQSQAAVRHGFSTAAMGRAYLAIYSELCGNR